MVVEVECRDSVSVSRPSQIAEVDHFAFFPKQGVKRLEIAHRNGVKGGANAGSTSRLAGIVDGVSVAVRVAGIRGKLPDISVCHATGLNSSFCAPPDGHVESGVSFSAIPTVWPALLIWLAAPLLPPSVGSGLMTPFCHTNARQVVPEDARPSAAKPQKSSPSGSGLPVWASPTACPHAFTLNAWPFCPLSP